MTDQRGRVQGCVQLRRIGGARARGGGGGGGGRVGANAHALPVEGHLLLRLLGDRQVSPVHDLVALRSERVEKLLVCLVGRNVYLGLAAPLEPRVPGDVNRAHHRITSTNPTAPGQHELLVDQIARRAWVGIKLERA